MAFTVNDVEVIFTPEDRAYREAFGTLVCELDAMQEGLYRTQKKCRPGRRNAGRKSYEVFTSMDTEMRVKLDALLGRGICEAIFGTTPSWLWRITHRCGSISWRGCIPAWIRQTARRTAMRSL